MWEEWTWYLFHLEAFCEVEFSGAWMVNSLNYSDWESGGENSLRAKHVYLLDWVHDEELRR
jgi:hypothetical protein